MQIAMSYISGANCYGLHSKVLLEMMRFSRHTYGSEEGKPCAFRESEKRIIIQR